MTNVLTNETLIKQMNAILKAGNNVTFVKTMLERSS